jgi:hypothetical protein
MSQSSYKVGNNLHQLVSKFVPNVPFQTCCSLQSTLNDYGPTLTLSNIKSLIAVAKVTKIYSANTHRITDRMLYLFFRKAVRMTGFDMGKSDRYTYSRIPR